MTAYRGYLERSFWNARQFLLAACLAALGIAAWWSLKPTGDDEGTPAARPRLPDYVVQQFSAVETDDTGRPTRHLTATELRHYAQEDVSELDRPRLDLLQTEGPPWHAESERGTVFAGGDQIRLEGRVQMDRPGDGENRPAHLETERLDIWRKQGLAETDLEVRVRSDDDALTANGMRLWYNEPTRTTFHGRARIRLAPEQDPQP
ncbi:LPS export ABC transporter periplasmic protein LptC [Imhoffiella purpurea]|uniref:Lipopolysaccharide export system protein LptC n=1 Tax=Imhoffiella purpurea TaxID=1249627 RepID=W9W1B8_9GAMM|nr:LPS export ABC transporter periplasmic protein LptC [Imhoffiella purpurea]EXJ16380.1 Putative protein YrbK clustered with lipopolysaccharide transporters [Imhoffiella purpurea]